MYRNQKDQVQAAGRTVLVVDDEQSIRELLSLLLEGEGYDVLTASRGDEALDLFCQAQHTIDLVILDLKMPGLGGIELLRELRSRAPAVPAIVVTAFSNWDDAVEAMRLGAYNYIRKPFDTETIRRVVCGAMEARSLWKNGQMSESGEDESSRKFVGNHPLMQNIFAMIQRVATTDSTVLIQGKSGTGKEMAARALHFRSHRRDRPFVPLNCSAFPDTLLESELFGLVRGAFTGAVEDKQGLFRIAEGGTVFLDEVGDMSLTNQVKLLRVLEERKISPIGSGRMEPIDVRIVAATNRVMEDEVLKANFREDLFYRLNVIPVFLPELKDRKDDIPLLVGHFLAKYSRLMHKSVSSLSKSAMQVLSEYRWPGNVRELENIIQRHVALCDGDVIEEVEISASRALRGVPAGATPTEASRQCLIPPEGINLEVEFEELEKRYLREALRMTKGHMTKAAKLLGMSYRSIRYRMQKLKLRETVDA